MGAGRRPRYCPSEDDGLLPDSRQIGPKAGRPIATHPPLGAVRVVSLRRHARRACGPSVS
jgi:hypothetical protein